jgi:hypothetical protein
LRCEKALKADPKRKTRILAESATLLRGLRQDVNAKYDTFGMIADGIDRQLIFLIMTRSAGLPVYF